MPNLDLTQAIADEVIGTLDAFAYEVTDGGVHRDDYYYEARNREAWALAAVVEAHLRPVVTTVAELDALPESTIILDGNGEIMKRCDRGQNVWHFANIAEHKAPALPATVLYRPSPDIGESPT